MQSNLLRQCPPMSPPLHRIRQSTNKAFPDLRGKFKVEVFGSFANGLSTWHSDVDLVVTGLFEPDRTTGCYDTKVWTDEVKGRICPVTKFLMIFMG